MSPETANPFQVTVFDVLRFYGFNFCGIFTGKSLAHTVVHQAPEFTYYISVVRYTVIVIEATHLAVVRLQNPNSLRHTLAGELLQNNVGINTIADILGHADSESTKNYLKVNIAALSKCTLEVVFDGE